MQISDSWQPGPVWAVPKPGLCWTPGRLCADRHVNLHSHIVAGAVQRLPQRVLVTCAWLTHSPLRACLHCLQAWHCTSAVHRHGSLVTCNLSSGMAWHASPVQAASPLRGTPAWGSEHAWTLQTVKQYHRTTCFAPPKSTSPPCSASLCAGRFPQRRPPADERHADPAGGGPRQLHPPAAGRSGPGGAAAAVLPRPGGQRHQLGPCHPGEPCHAAEKG